MITNPLASLDEDYGAAVVRLTWAVTRRNAVDLTPGDRLLLCAAVELVPAEIPPPVVGGERCAEISKRFFLFAQDVLVSARQGLEWFSLAAAGTALRPLKDGSLPLPLADGSPRFVVSPLDEEPPSPALAAATKIVPFVASWHGTARVRHLIARDNPIAHFTAEERAGAAAWLRGEVHVDLDEFDEYWGSVHLIAPNPVFRSVRARHVRDGEHSELVIAIIPRAGRRLAGLQLLVEEERATGWGVVTSAAITSPVTRLPLPEVLGGVRERILDPARGTLHDSGFGIFNPSFSFTGNLVTQFRRVQAGPEDQYEVPLVGSHKVGGEVNSGAPRPRAVSLYTSSTRRIRRANGRASQKWFRDQERDGVQALRAAIKTVKSSVLLVDPYFGGDDVRRIILAIPEPAIAVRVLTSELHLRRLRGNPEDDSAPTPAHPPGVRRVVGRCAAAARTGWRVAVRGVKAALREEWGSAQPEDRSQSEGAYLTRCIAEAEAAPYSNPITVHVMPGRQPAVHDRFLCDPGRLWMLGSSINAFGRRGTLMIAVPDPDPVVDDLERVWDDSVSLEKWLAHETGASP